MTIDNIVMLARLVAYRQQNNMTGDFARAVIDLLAVDAVPCGYETPTAGTDGGEPCVRHESLGAMAVDDCRALAVMLLRAADAADAGGGS